MGLAATLRNRPQKREDAKELGSLAFIMKKLFSKQLTEISVCLLFMVLVYVK